MKKLNASEMRAVDGSFGLLGAAAALAAGANVGIYARIAYEHKRYGKCITYKSRCWTCKHRW